MPVPEFQSFMLPLLRNAADGKEHTSAEARDALAKEFGLSEEERNQLLPSGQQPRFSNRCNWAINYLQQADLLRATKRGVHQITERGTEVMKAPPSRIDIRFLEQFPEFLEFRSRKTEEGTETEKSSYGSVSTHTESETPEEAMEGAYSRLRASLASELLGRVKSGSSQFFETLVVGLLIEMGYGGSRRDAGQAIGKSGDEGIDGVISEDRLGLDVVYIQAKKWDGTVGRPDIQKFVGALHGRRAKKGVFITTGSFSAEAFGYVEKIEPKVVLIDGRRLASLMIDFNVGVTTTGTYHTKRVDSDFFEDE